MSTFITSAGTRVVWLIATASSVEIMAILYIVIRDLMKNTRNIFVIKDNFTVYFIIYILIALTFKIFLIDTYYKGELKHKRKCSFFISEYIP